MTDQARPPIAYRVPEACRETGVGHSTIYNAIRSGELRPTKVGRRTLIEHVELQRWISSKRQPAKRP